MRCGNGNHRQSQAQEHSPDSTLKRLVKSSRRAVKSWLPYSPFRAFKHFRRTSRCYWGEWKYEWLLLYLPLLDLHTSLSDCSSWAWVSSILKTLRCLKKNEWLSSHLKPQIILFSRIKQSWLRGSFGYHPGTCITTLSITVFPFHRESLSSLNSVLRHLLPYIYPSLP